MNEKKIEAAESALVVVEPTMSFEEIGHIEFDGISKLKSSLFGGYNKESVLDNIDKIIEQSETQLTDMKRHVKVQERRNALLQRQNDELRDEIFRLVSQLKEEQEDFVTRFATKEEQIDLLQRENRQLREKIERDKRILIERMKLQIGMHNEVEKQAEEPVPEQEHEPYVELPPKPTEKNTERRSILRENAVSTKPATLPKQEKAEAKPEPKPLYNTVSELLNSGALNKESLERPKAKAAPQESAAPQVNAPPQAPKNTVIDLPTMPKLTTLSGGDKNWDLDSILEEYGD